MNITKPILAGIIAGSLLIGGIAGASTQPVKTVEKPIERVVEKPITKPEWAQLKALDDEIIGLAGEGLQAASEAFDAASRLDPVGIDTATEKMNTIASKLRTKGPERQALLSKLGY